MHSSFSRYQHNNSTKTLNLQVLQSILTLKPTVKKLASRTTKDLPDLICWPLHSKRFVVSGKSEIHEKVILFCSHQDRCGRLQPEKEKKF